jgi:hypothetical protein
MRLTGGMDLRSRWLVANRLIFAKTTKTVAVIGSPFFRLLCACLPGTLETILFWESSKSGIAMETATPLRDLYEVFLEETARNSVSPSSVS